MTLANKVFERLRDHPEREHGAGASADAVQSAEGDLAIRILGSYRTFLEGFGWGGVGPVEIYGLGTDVPDHLELVRITKSERLEMHPALPHALLPIVNDGSGNLICLDTSSTAADPPLVLWDHEAGPAQIPTRCAETFSDWLDAYMSELGEG
jgi:hypothetical protein